MPTTLPAPTRAPAAPTPQQSYDAFISYKQATESRLAMALRAELHAFAKPWHQLRAVRVFVDRSNLDGNPRLWGSIEAAVRASRYLIYLASPEAAESPWVRQELTEFLRNNPTERLIIVLVAGEIAWDRAARDFDWEKTTALPRLEPGLFTPGPAVLSDALYHDARWARGRARLSSADPEFHDLVATISSTIRGIPKDALAGEDIRQRRKSLRLARWGGATLAVLAAALAIAAFLAIRETRTATRRLARTYVESGSRLLESGDPAGALPWFLAGWKLEKRDPEKSEMHQLRFAAALSQASRPRYAWWVSGRPWLVGFSPDGTRVLVTGGDMPEFEGENVDGPAGIGTVEIRTAGPGGPAPVRLSHRGAVSAAVFSPDSRRVLSASFDSTAALWDAATGRELRPRWRHRDMVKHAEWDPAGRRVLTVSDSVRVRDAGFTEPPVSAPIGFPPDGATFSPDGNQVAIHGGKSVAVWDLRTRRVRVLATGIDEVFQVVFTPSGREIAIRAAGRVAILDVRTGARRTLSLSPDAAVGQILVSADGRSLVTLGGWGGHAATSTNGEARVWSTETLQPAGSAMRAIHGFTAGALSPDGCWVALASDNGTVFLWSVAPESLQCPLLSRSVMHHGGAVQSVAFGPDGRSVITSSWDGGIRIWDVSRRDLRRTGEADTVLRSLDDGPAPGDNVTYSADGQWAVQRIVEESGDTLKVFPRAQPSRTWTVTVPGYVHDVALSHDGRYLGAGGKDSVARVWDVRRREPLGPPRPHGDGVWYVTFSPDGRRLFVAGNEGRGRVWDVERGDSVGSAVHHAWTIYQAAFDESGRWIVTGSADGSARVWDVKTGAPRTPPLRHGPSELSSSGVRFVSFMPGGGRVVSVDEGGEVRIWDAATGELVSRLDPIGRLWEVSFRAGGGLIARRSRVDTFVWDIAAPPLPFAEAERWAKMLGNGRVDETGALVPLGREETRALVTGFHQ